MCGLYCLLKNHVAREPNNVQKPTIKAVHAQFPVDADWAPALWKQRKSSQRVDEVGWTDPTVSPLSNNTINSGPVHSEVHSGAKMFLLL